MNPSTESRAKLVAPALIVASALLTACFIASSPVVAQVQGSTPAYVKLQASSPGATQTGHSNISGTSIAGFFQGDGSQLTGLDVGNVSFGLLATSFGGIGFDSSTAGAGALLVANGSGWELLGPDSDGSVLTLSGGLPTWMPGNTTLSLPYSGAGDDGGASALFSVEDAGALAAIQGTSTGPQGIGIQGVSTDTTTYSFGGYFTSDSPLGRGIFAQNTSATGPSIAGRFGSPSPDTTVVYVTASSTADGEANAIFGESFAVSGTGLRGYATNGTPNRFPVGVEGDVANKDGVGVYGYNYASTGRSTGVYAASGTIGSGSAALFVLGNSLVVGTKSFLIDDPSDPTNQNLRHYCQEGPAPYNVYKGRVTTGSDGLAWVQLPSYFASINTDPDYQLTVVDSSDDFVLAKVVHEVENNRFQIRTNKPKVVVCWEVKALRNDPWVRATGYSDIEPKLPSEKGKYLVPQLYGQPLSRAVNPRLRSRSDSEVISKGP